MTGAHDSYEERPLTKTKIVATVGPACWAEPQLRRLVNAGVESVELARGEDGQCGSRRPPCISAMGCRLPVMRSTPSPVLRPWFGDS